MHSLRYLPLVLACGALTSCSEDTDEPVRVPEPPISQPKVVIAKPIPTPKPVKPPVALPPAPKLGREGYQLILEHEVGGGQPYFDQALARPSVPPGESGVTIGVGYDLRFNTRTVFRSDWHELPSDHLDRLSGACGLNHSASQAKVQTLRDILIEWRLAEEVFNDVTVTRFFQLAKRTFPGMEDLDERAQAVLVSLTFNRGSDMGNPSRPSWDSRREMRAIRELVPKKDYRGMAAQIRKMKRLWEGKGMNGLLRRREDEARLMEACA